MASIDDMIKEIDQELEDMNYAQAEASKKGLTLGDYDLQSATQARRNDRQNETTTSPLSEDSKKPVTTINGEVVETPVDAKTEEAPYSENIVEKNVDGVIIRRNLAGEQLMEGLDMERAFRNPYSQNKWISENRKKEGEESNIYVEGEAVDVTENMIKESPNLQAYQKNLNVPIKKVVQVYDKSNNTAWLEPVFEEKDVKSGEPKKSDYTLHLDPNLAYQKAMKKYYEGDYTTPRLKAHGL